VGGLPQEATEILVYELFTQVGPVDRVSIPRAEGGETHKGFAFVQFAHGAVNSAEHSVNYAVNPRISIAPSVTFILPHFNLHYAMGISFMPWEYHCPSLWKAHRHPPICQPLSCTSLREFLPIPIASLAPPLWNPWVLSHPLVKF